MRSFEHFPRIPEYLSLHICVVLEDKISRYSMESLENRNVIDNRYSERDLLLGNLFVAPPPSSHSNSPTPQIPTQCRPHHAYHPSSNRTRASLPTTPSSSPRARSAQARTGSSSASYAKPSAGRPIPNTTNTTTNKGTSVPTTKMQTQQ